MVLVLHGYSVRETCLEEIGEVRESFVDGLAVMTTAARCFSEVTEKVF